MQKDFVLEFKPLFGQHRYAIGQMRGIDCLTRLSEKLFQCIGFGLVGFYTVSKCSIYSAGESDDKKVIHFLISLCVDFVECFGQ